MFQGCSSLTDLTPIKNWNTSSLHGISYIFEECDKLTFVDFSNWNLKGIYKNGTSHAFDLSKGTAPLLVISSNEQLRTYDYARSNRTPVGPTFDAGGGMFLDYTSSKQGNTTYVLDNTTTAVDSFLENTIKTMEIPTRDGYIFTGWKVNLNEDATAYDRMNATYIAQWKKEEGKAIWDHFNESVDNNMIDTSDPIRVLTSSIVLILSLVAMIKMIKYKNDINVDYANLLEIMFYK